MFEVGVVARFSAWHRLRGDFGPAGERHGHTYRVEVSARGRALRDDGTLVDLTALERAVAAAVDSLRERDLDEVGILDGANTTAEALARHICGVVRDELRAPGIAGLAVRVWESDESYGGYEERPGAV